MLMGIKNTEQQQEDEVKAHTTLRTIVNKPTHHNHYQTLC